MLTVFIVYSIFYEFWIKAIGFSVILRKLILLKK